MALKYRRSNTLQRVFNVTEGVWVRCNRHSLSIENRLFGRSVGPNGASKSMYHLEFCAENTLIQKLRATKKDLYLDRWLWFQSTALP